MYDLNFQLQTYKFKFDFVLDLRRKAFAFVNSSCLGVRFKAMFGGRGVPTFDGDFAAGVAAFGVPLCCCSVATGEETWLFCGCSAATGSATAGASAGGCSPAVAVGLVDIGVYYDSGKF